MKNNFDIQEVCPGWYVNRLSIKDQLQYKFLLSIEGNDVASNLKWCMYSNSCVIMPRPTCVTWFMEDYLKPYVHYVPIKEDLSDLEEKYIWCMNNLDFCYRIAQNGKEYVKTFLDFNNESYIEGEVIKGYFEKTEIV